MTPEIKQFINKLQPKDIGEEQIGKYIVAFEGFTDSCFDYLVENNLTIEETEKFLIETWNNQFGTPIETNWRNEIVTYTEPNILYSIYRANKQATMFDGIPLKIEKIIEGKWAIYDYEVYVKEGDVLHDVWFKQIGLPTTGRAFDNITRGRYIILHNTLEIRWYSDTGTNDEFEGRLNTLIDKIGHKDLYEKLSIKRRANKQANLKMTHEDFGPENYIPSSNTVTGVATGTLPTKLLRDSNIVDLVRTRETLTTGDFNSLKQDIKENGIQTPLTIAIEKNNTITIIDGTHRLLAAEELGIEEVPVDVRFFGGINKTHPEVLKDVEINNMNKQATKNIKYKVIFYNMESPDEGIHFYDTEEEAEYAGKEWLKEDDYNEYTIYPIEEKQASSQPIEIIDNIDTTCNSLKSLDKISYKMEDILNEDLNIELTKKKEDIIAFMRDREQWEAGLHTSRTMIGELTKSGFNKTWTQTDWDKEKTAMTTGESKERGILDTQGMTGGTIVEQSGTLFLNMDALSNRHSDTTLSDETREALLSIKGKYKHVNTSSDKFAQSKQADTTLFNNPWITIRQDNEGYTYASVPEGVAILPYKTENDKTLYMLRSEQNSVLAPEGSLITVITGRRDDTDVEEDKEEQWYIQCAIRELEEEAGIIVTEDKITLLGEMSTNKHTKQSDMLLAIDVTGLEENEPEGDGTDDEAQSYNFWVDEKGLRDFIRTSKDSYLATITNKFFNKDVNLSIVSMGRI